jgi:hypothetical protein
LPIPSEFSDLLIHITSAATSDAGNPIHLVSDPDNIRLQVHFHRLSNDFRDRLSLHLAPLTEEVKNVFIKIDLCAFHMMYIYIIMHWLSTTAVVPLAK